jgi:hypothetical protein
VIIAIVGLEGAFQRRGQTLAFAVGNRPFGVAASNPPLSHRGQRWPAAAARRFGRLVLALGT